MKVELNKDSQLELTAETLEEAFTLGEIWGTINDRMDVAWTTPAKLTIALKTYE